MGVVFVGTHFALTIGVGLLSAQTSEGFFGISSKSVSKSSKISGKRKVQDVTSYLWISAAHWWYL